MLPVNLFLAYSAQTNIPVAQLIVLAAATWLIWKMTRKKDTLCDSCDGRNLPSMGEFTRGRDRGAKDNPSHTPGKAS